MLLGGADHLVGDFAHQVQFSRFSMVRVFQVDQHPFKQRSKVQHRTKDKLRKATEAHMSEIEQTPERVKSYFQDPIVQYAA